MKLLQDILYKAGVLEISGALDLHISHIAFDSRNVKKGGLFIAVPGTQADGHTYIEPSIAGGARVVVCTQLPQLQNEAVTYVKVKDTAFALGQIASNFYDRPSGKIILTGVTGTNGKTTTVTLLHQLFVALGYKTGLISTIENKIHQRLLPSTHTTPDAIQLNQLLDNMVSEGCEYVFMEVSSHAIEQHRIAGLQFRGAVFTNITHDHLDYHKTFRNYLEVKKRFFDSLPKSAFALSNIDDKNGGIILQNTKAKKSSYSLKKMADFKGRIIENLFEGMQIQINNKEIHSLLTGNFNAYNLLAVYATAILLGQDEDEILTALSSLKGAEGRFDILRSKEGITAFIDYAHTPDALENVLSTINNIRTHNEQLITVVGAGGDRDREKRPKMAAIASNLSNILILTSDNPRNEDPEKIIDDMLKGIDPSKTRKTMVIPNRKEAIKTAVNLAHQGDVILVAGKGHEKYQEIKGIKYPFDDKEILTELFENQ